ncbi:Radical SAM domain protein [Magnetococcus marinus MC-1]|uniref:Radical SAM domain protein n=1 Tax=Magnetococcus marinus (strain ATCC BAA-1437 / JCM 17883 / MC-1) TaxID=156889 RepID=A0LBW1_MAGMM|nr:radical SAM protein [Magnetococcus marinus]ABK45454.1 Radical SAM domain protein [Magnetococcus marinus MC-1]
MFEYAGPLYRPPSEAAHLILQATIGCSVNHCTFCSMYRHKRFHIKPLPQLFKEIEHAASAWPTARRVFLADGDALVLPTDHLERILDHLRRHLPQLQRVSCYALPANLRKKSLRELNRLAAKKLTLIYYGMESGDANLLKIIRKGATPEGMAAGVWKAHEAGLKISATVILGLGGQRLWQSHIDHTAELINRVPLSYLSTLQLYLDPHLEAAFLARFTPPFQFQQDHQILQELAQLVAAINHPPKRIIFRSNHASNALALAGNLPDHQAALLARIAQAQANVQGLRPTWTRSL